MLLKNTDGLLPLPATTRTIALVGPLAEAPLHMLGPWAGAGSPEHVVAALLDVSSTRLSADNLDRMAQMIEDARKEGK